jgi:LPXTG-motif cell wall-anchored protein
MNSAGVTLPNTGGTGTFMLYLLGFALVAFAGTVLMIRRRFVSV